MIYDPILSRRSFWLARDSTSWGKPSKDDVREEMKAMAQAELELLTDPGFFTSLPNRFPSHIEHIEIMPKRMKANNELRCYRYAAIIHLGH